ncbi:MAG: glycosyltransferase [bacterium]
MNKWYPNIDNPNGAIFIRKHAKAVSIFAKVISFHITSSKKNKSIFKIDKFKDENIDTIIIYYKKLPLIFDSFLYFVSLIIGTFIILKDYKKIDLVQVNITASLMLIIALFLKLFKKIKFIVFEHSSFYMRIFSKLEKLNLLKRIILFFVKKIVLFSEGIVCVSESLKNSMKSLGFYNNFYVIPNVVFEDFENIKIKQNFDENIIKIISVFNLNDKTKNISGLLKGFRKFLESYGQEFKDKNIILDIYGDGKDRQKLVKLAIELNLLDKNVFFKGSIDNKVLKSIMGDYDFFVMFSRVETFSVATLEAMLCGLPVIATNCGGPEEYLKPEFGILIEKENIDQLVNAFYFMCKNYKNFDRKRISEFVIENYSYKRVSLYFKELYEKILK